MLELLYLQNVVVIFLHGTIHHLLFLEKSFMENALGDIIAIFVTYRVYCLKTFVKSIYEKKNTFRERVFTRIFCFLFGK